MIKKLLQRVFNSNSKKKQARQSSPDSGQSKAKHIPTKVHRIDPKLISQGPLHTIEGSTKAGFEAYIVGGAVRDLLLKHPPKSLYRAPHAQPETFNNLMPRSRIHDRRFP